MASELFREIPIVHRRTVNGVTEGRTGKLALRFGRSDNSVDLYEGAHFYIGSLGLHDGDSAHQLADALAEAINRKRRRGLLARFLPAFPSVEVQRAAEVTDRQAWLDDVRRRLGLVTIEHGQPEPPDVPLMLPGSAARTIALLELAAEFDARATAGKPDLSQLNVRVAFRTAARLARAAAERSEQARESAPAITETDSLPEQLIRAWKEHPEVVRHRRWMTRCSVTPVPPPASPADNMPAAIDALAIQGIPVAAVVLREGFQHGFTSAYGHPVIRAATSALEWGIVSTTPLGGDGIGEVAIGKLRAGLADPASRLATLWVIADQPFWQDPAWWQFRAETEEHLDRLARASIPVKAIALRADPWPGLATFHGYPVIAVPADCPFRWGVVT